MGDDAQRREARRTTLAINTYIDNLGVGVRRRPADKERLKQRLAALEQRAADAPTPARRLALTQQVIDAEAELAAAETDTATDEAERAFIAVAADYAAAKGLSHAAFRRLGVPAKVLEAAGIPRPR